MVLLLYHGHLVQNIMVVYGIESVLSVSWPSCTEHYGSVWYRVCYLLYRGHLVQNIMVVYGIECVVCCIVAILYRTLW